MTECNSPTDFDTDRLSSLSDYLKTKGFGWAFVWTECLIGSGRLFRKTKIKNTKKCQVRKFSPKPQNSFQILSKIDGKTPAIPFAQITTQF